MNISNQNCCPRCGKVSSGQRNRLITDSCGHRKCRRCLLADEDGCLECLQHQQEATGMQQSAREAALNDGKGTSKRKNKSKKTAVAIPVHIQRVQNEAGILQYHCAICKKTFSRSQQYYHLHCGEDEAKKYQCTQCEKGFSARSHLKYHLETHSSQIYACPQCNKVFKNKAVLKKHEKLHGETRLYACNECSKVFRSKESLAVHVDKHLNNLRFQCKVCDRKYAAKSALQQHLLKHLGKKHQCTHCGKRFQRNSTLKLHLRKHSKTDSFTCTKCFKKFSDAGALLRHAKLHEDGVKYKCIHCDITSIRKDNLLRHVRNIHIGEIFESCVEVIKPADKESHSCEEVPSQNELAYVPKAIENSSVIRCIGNVEPVKIPDLPAPIDAATTKTLTVLQTVAEATATVSQKKTKKKYDPIQMYRKILIDDDCDEELPSEGKECADVPVADVPEEFSQPDASKTDAAGPQRAPTLNTSNFTEMHWRKNFKYTYEYREY